jgi:hypothetical protein
MELMMTGIGVVLAVFFTGFLIKEAVYFMKTLQSRSWPKAPGKILSSDLEPHWMGWMKRPAIKYEYQMGGHRYLGSTVSFLEIPVFISAIQKVKEYPAGADVEVYYDPAHPGQAVLEHPSGLRGVLYMAAGFLGIFLAVVIMV